MSALVRHAASLVTGGAGFLGRAVVGSCAARGRVVAPRSADYDLTDAGPPTPCSPRSSPTSSIHLAARVGGIGYNQAAPADAVPRQPADGHLRDRGGPPPRHGARRCWSARCARIRSSRRCRSARSSLWDGYPEETNAPYGIAKKAQLVHAQVNAEQYGQRFAYLIPTNLYGPGDKFHPSRVPRHPRADQEVRRGGEAGRATRSRSGARAGPAASTSTSTTPPRASCWPPSTLDEPDPVNLGADHEITIRETVENIARARRLRRASCVWDPTKPDGQPRRRVDASRAEQLLGWRAAMPFDEGLRRTIDWYLARDETRPTAPPAEGDKLNPPRADEHVDGFRRPWRARRWRPRATPRRLALPRRPRRGRSAGGAAAPAARLRSCFDR